MTITYSTLRIERSSLSDNEHLKKIQVVQIQTRKDSYHI